MHLTEEDLILHYYGEDEHEPRVERHLMTCDVCRDELARLQHVLSMVTGQEVPDLPPSFERTVWARLEPQLAQHRRRWFDGLFHASPRWVLVGGVAVLVLAAFVAGRFSSVSAPPAATVANAPTDINNRVLVVAVVDHLDQSQMVLIELMNADATDATDLVSERERARELVAANRLYRQSAAQNGDQATSDVLDDLERVLLELANGPADSSVIDLDALRARIASRGLLFRVRVVQSEMRERERQKAIAGSTS